jgi:hypothetical protein
MGVRASVFVGALTAAAIVPAVAAAQAPSAAPSAVALPEPTASGDAALADKARAIFVMAQSGKIDRAQFDSGWNKISDAHVAKVGVWAASLGAV